MPKKPIVRVSLLLLAFFLWCVPSWAAPLGSVYSLNTLMPFLEQGFVTREAWQGRALTGMSRHLYYYDPVKQTDWGTLEFGVTDQRVTRVLLKWSQTAPAHVRQQILLTFLQHYAEKTLTLGQLQSLMKKDCQGEWRLKPDLYLTYLSTAQHHFFKISRGGSVSAPQLPSRCFLP